jgi:pathogenesis-related protein 1
MAKVDISQSCPIQHALSGDSGSSLDAAISSDVAVPLSTEATTWLSEHNSRRQRYHTMYGSSYVPLRWSASLAASATRYAEEMARTGDWRHSDSPYGENLAWNGGIQSRAISDILTRWVENEEASWGGHFTQVLWRGTRYVGCGRASSPQHGSFQACQYAAPGNCGNRRRETMLADRTGCLPECPPEGCF